MGKHRPNKSRSKSEPPYGRTRIERRKGRPTLCVNDANGHPVLSEDPAAYLVWDAGKSKFALSTDGKRTMLGKDIQVAIRGFREWVNSHKPEPIQIDNPDYFPEPEPLDGVPECIDPPIGHEGKKKPPHEVAPRDFWRQVHDLFYDLGPREFARLSGVAEVARVYELEKPTAPVTLDRALFVYLTLKKDGSKEEVANTIRIKPNRKLPVLTRNTPLSREQTCNAKRFWTEFKNAVAPASNLSEVTEAHVEKWGRQLWEAHRRPENSRGRIGGTTFRHKVATVGTILRQAAKLDRVNAERIRIYLGNIELPAREDTEANPITPADFRGLLDAATDVEKAMLLVQLNCCFYAADVRRLPRRAVDLELGTVAFKREKARRRTRVQKPIPRVAVLWRETLQAVSPFVESGDSETVFVTKEGEPYSKSGFRNLFYALRRRAGLEHVQNSQIRDGAYDAVIQAAARGDAEMIQAKILGGHYVDQSAIPDKYWKRVPQTVEAGCRAIAERYGFTARKVPVRRTSARAGDSV